MSSLLQFLQLLHTLLNAEPDEVMCVRERRQLFPSSHVKKDQLSRCRHCFRCRRAVVVVAFSTDHYTQRLGYCRGRAYPVEGTDVVSSALSELPVVKLACRWIFSGDGVF